MILRPLTRHASCGTIALYALLHGPLLHAAAPAQVTNPISRIARIFDSQLVKTEDRVTWLETRVSTLAQQQEQPLKTDLGYRGCRGKIGEADPSVTLDLGTAFPLDSIYLIPAQREFMGDPGIFPKRFTIELSNREDFAQRTILFTSGTNIYPSPEGFPVLFNARDKARYVRLTVHEGHNKGVADLFGLSEIVVISNREPVSFGAAVTTVGGLESPGIWFPAALTDGKSPLGIWQNGFKPDSELGDATHLASAEEAVSWTLPLHQAADVDRVVLFPYQISRSYESSVFPQSLLVEITDASGQVETVYEWENPLPGASSMTPIMIPLRQKVVSAIKVTARKPYLIGDQKISALSEIEVWADSKNIASGLTVTRLHGEDETSTAALTDGYASMKQIIPVSTWLEQLCERGRIERELNSLRPIHHQLSSESELNATWGSAVVLGLTFLIPVFIVERRRLMSRDQLDQLRKRIASDLHDDIGSNLGSISLIARTARKDLVRLKGPEEVAEDLGEVESIARESSLAMRDIVWLLERRQDSIGDLVERMRETAGRLLREVHFTLECESSKTAAKLSLDAKRHLFLFYKEAVHNVLKHSQAKNVSIRLWDEDDKLALEIADDGIGLPRSEKPGTTGVRKLDDRAAVLEGILQVESSKGAGTRIRLLVKRSHLTAHPTLS